LAEGLITQYWKPTQRAMDANGNSLFYARAKAWLSTKVELHTAHLRQQYHNSKFCDFSGVTFKGFEFYNFL
jgi:hypothetical protein